MSDLPVKTKVLDRGFVELQAVMGGDLDIVNAARVSFLGESKGDEKDRKLLDYLIKNYHDSPLEMVEFKFRVKAPIFTARQWMRSRMWSYNEVSRRYTSEEIEFYVPEVWRGQSKDNKQASEGEVEAQGWMWEEYESHINNSVELYEIMLEEGVARELARMVLPQSLYTQFIAKVDLRNLLHFIDLRSDSHAQWEIQQYSNAMLELISPYVPWTIESYNRYRKNGE